MTTLSKTALLMLGALAVVGCKPKDDKPAAKADKPAPIKNAQKAVRVEVASIRPSSAAIAITRPGEVEASRDAKLAAALGGYVERVLVKTGDRVKKGAILALIDTASHSVRRRQAKIELKAAKRELKRSLMVKDAIPEVQLDAAKTRVDAAKAGLHAVEVAAARSVITAPFAGVIDSVGIEVGEVAPPGQPIIRLLKLDTVTINVAVSDRDVMSVNEGMTATVGTDAQGWRAQGVVKRKRRAADMQTRAFEVEIEVANPEEKLLPGMIANVTLNRKVADNRVVISNDWLVTRLDGVGVYTHVAGKAKYSPVKLGPIVGNHVVIDEGLKAGDDLIVVGHRELSDGDRLIVARRGVCCTEGRVMFGNEGAAKVKVPAVKGAPAVKPKGKAK